MNKFIFSMTNTEKPMKNIFAMKTEYRILQSVTVLFQLVFIRKTLNFKR